MYSTIMLNGPVIILIFVRRRYARKTIFNFFYIFDLCDIGLWPKYLKFAPVVTFVQRYFH